MARKIGAIKTSFTLWQSHENLYCSIFYEALNQLKINDKQRKDEDTISEALCPILNTICFERERDIAPPVWESPIQPVRYEELKGGKVRKRPDFTCVFINSFANSPEMYAIPFHVECKRLGQKVGSYDLFNNYINKGIRRFDSSDHEYGKRAPSGLMIGYIINMDQNTILEKVNGYLNADFPKLIFLFNKKIVSCEQMLIRKQVKPKKFRLIHLWANLKN